LQAEAPVHAVHSFAHSDKAKSIVRFTDIESLAIIDQVKLDSVQ